MREQFSYAISAENRSYVVKDVENEIAFGNGKSGNICIIRSFMGFKGCHNPHSSV